MQYLTDDLVDILRSRPASWLVTGAAGFIGSNLVESLLAADQKVVGLDNFATGHQRNLDQLLKPLSPAQRERFRFVRADILDRAACEAAVEGVDHILHQAALGSVPRSMADPLASHDANVTGFVNLLDAARRAGTQRLIYAASSSTYGDDPNLPKREERIGNPVSPYAATKLINEIYAAVFARCFGMEAVGLRYFNVFGPRQDPDGAYAAVIPKWTAAMVKDEPVVINGDGETSRDFCFVANAVQANIRAALAGPEAQNQVYNVATGARTSLLGLFGLLRDLLGQYQISYRRAPEFAEFRPGDVRHTEADISKATNLIGYRPTHTLRQGLEEALPWYIGHFAEGR